MTSPTTSPFNAVWGTSADSVYAVGSNATLIHYNGSDWTTMSMTGITTTVSFNDIWGVSDDDFIIVGDDGKIFKYDGTAWKSIISDSDSNLKSVWYNKSSQIIVSGEDGKILHCDDSTCQRKGFFSGTSLNGIWGNSASDIYVAGAKGTIVHYDGSDWTEMDSPVTSNLNAIWGNSANFIYAVGEDGTAVFYGGSSWTKKTLPTTRDFYGIGGSVVPYIYICGVDGKLYSYDSSWQAAESNTTEVLRDIWASANDDVFMVGNNGIIMLNSATISAQNTAPTAAFTLTPESGTVETAFFGDASDCTDEQDETDLLEVSWDWGDGSAATEYTTEKIEKYQYAAEGNYTITLTVRDSGGLTDTTSTQVVVGSGGNGGDGGDGGDDNGTCPAGKVLGDDTPQLDELREVRDYLLVHSPAGRLLIRLYYAQAPAINAALERNPALRGALKQFIETLTCAVR